MKKIYFLGSLFLFLNPSVDSTPEYRTEYEEKYLGVIELIMEKNKIDIENRGLYEFSFLKFKNNCEAEVKLKHYSPLIEVFEVNVCKKTSIISKAEKSAPVWDLGGLIHWILGVANTKKCVLNVCEISLNLQKKFLKLLISTVYIPTLRPPGEFISPK